MELALAQLRDIFAAIILVAVFVMVGSEPAPGEAIGMVVEFGIARDRTAVPAGGSGSLSSQTASTARDRSQDDCWQDCSTNCVPLAGSGCCAAAIPLTSGWKAADRAPTPAYEMDAGFLGTGIDPQLHLRPPQAFA